MRVQEYVRTAQGGHLCAKVERISAGVRGAQGDRHESLGARSQPGPRQLDRARSVRGQHVAVDAGEIETAEAALFDPPRKRQCATAAGRRRPGVRQGVRAIHPQARRPVVAVPGRHAGRGGRFHSEQNLVRARGQRSAQHDVAISRKVEALRSAHKRSTPEREGPRPVRIQDVSRACHRLRRRLPNGDSGCMPVGRESRDLPRRPRLQAEDGAAGVRRGSARQFQSGYPVWAAQRGRRGRGWDSRKQIEGSVARFRARPDERFGSYPGVDPGPAARRAVHGHEPRRIHRVAARPAGRDGRAGAFQLLPREREPAGSVERDGPGQRSGSRRIAGRVRCQGHLPEEILPA